MKKGHDGRMGGRHGVLTVYSIGLQIGKLSTVWDGGNLLLRWGCYRHPF